jgi:hypothetical protein
MQVSEVFSQRHWPLHGDLDDCWVVSSLQVVHAVMPWLRLPSVRRFRAEAGDPDDGVRDGGNVAEIMRGMLGTWPVLQGHLEPFRGASWSSLEAGLAEGRPVTVAVDSSRLPAGIRYEFNGAHQVTVWQRADGHVLVANPLAEPHSQWDELNNATPLRPAIMGYGRLRTTWSGAWGVMLPTEADCFKLHPLYVPSDTAALAAARAEGYAEAKRAAIRATSAI